MDAELSDLIERARHYEMTPQERFEQRVSLIYGLSGGDISKEKVRDFVRDFEGHR